MSAVVRRGVEGPRGPETTAADTIDDFGSACLLLLLDERPATAPELFTHLRRLGLVEDGVDPARLGALLRRLESEGLVDQSADPASAGSLYSLTLEGAERLGSAADYLRSTQIMLRRFLARCGERLVL